MDTTKLILSSVVIAIFLNILLSSILSPLASVEEINPPTGAANLPFNSQIMHMLVHHKQVMLSSSLIVGLLVGSSIYISCKCLKKYM